MTILRNAKIFADRLEEKLIYNRRSYSEMKYDHAHVYPYLAPTIKLTADEKEEVKRLWGDVVPVPLTRGYEFYKGTKALFGFDARFLPSSYYYPYIEGVLNPERWKKALSHKGMIEVAYSAAVGFPETIVRTFGGVFMDKDYNPMLREEVVKALNAVDSPVLYKPATDSEQGNGIRFIRPEEMPPFIEEIKNGSIFNDHADFVIQKPLTQTEDTKIFNPTSLNCVRITTININGEISVGSAALKCGPKNSHVDNIGNGKRGVMVGVDKDGQLADFGFYGNGEKATAHNGVPFKGHKITAYSRMVDAAKKLHSYAEACKIIGWDLALDENDNPVLIEGNTIYPGISVEQMCSGPIFGERTEEVVEYVKKMQK